MLLTTSVRYWCCTSFADDSVTVQYCCVKRPKKLLLTSYHSPPKTIRKKSKIKNVKIKNQKCKNQKSNTGWPAISTQKVIVNGIFLKNQKSKM
jgi:hypothetical protein